MEQARESLIAISYTSPEEKQKPLTSSDVKPVTKRNSEVAEKLKLELISISYHDSPDEPISSPKSICRG
ncbi:hypothetical protein N665_0173s0017 [Sinapis alba]|nr:hypothetical protein N665_0173s0017 [Sinapis alba]